MSGEGETMVFCPVRKIVISTGVVTKFAGFTVSGNSGSLSIGYVDSDNSSL